MSEDTATEEPIVSPQAVISRDAKIGDRVRIDPFTVIEGQVKIGNDVSIGPFCHIREGTTIEDKCRIETGAIIGILPKEGKQARRRETNGDNTTVYIGEGTIVGEKAAIERPGSADAKTIIGKHVRILPDVYIGQSSKLGNHAYIINGTKLAGYITLGDGVMIGGNVGIHQFVSIGTLAFLGGGTNITKDVVPYAWLAQNKDPKKKNMPRVYGINAIGMKRAGMTKDKIEEVKEVFAAMKLEPTLDDKITWLTAMRTNAATTMREFLEKSTRGSYLIEGNRSINPTSLYKNAGQYHSSK